MLLSRLPSSPCGRNRLRSIAVHNLYRTSLLSLSFHIYFILLKNLCNFFEA